MNIRMIACEPLKLPIETILPESVEAILKFVNGWFEVIGLGNKFILYCNEHPKDLPFNRMFRGRPIFGNFLISKYGFIKNNRSNLSDVEITNLITELTPLSKNNTN